MMAYHCDREGCDAWQRLPTANPLWLIVTGGTSNTRLTNHFCTIHCLMHWAAAHSEPTESIPT